MGPEPSRSRRFNTSDQRYKGLSLDVFLYLQAATVAQRDPYNSFQGHSGVSAVFRARRFTLDGME